MPEPNITKAYLEVQSDLVKQLWHKIDDAHTVIVEQMDPEVEAENIYFKNSEFNSAFDGYNKILTRLHNKLEKFMKPEPTIHFPDNVVINATQNKSNIKIKPIDIPQFSGDYMKWISFINMFDSLIHNNADFTKLQKMHYLKSCLLGEAERIISQYNITEDDYEPAYGAIRDRYHNEVILVDTHIMAIISQPDLETESGESLKELLDVTSENIHALKGLGIDTKTWDPILLLLLTRKLDPATRRLWELNLKPKTRPSLKEFLEFLGTRFNALGCQQNFKFSISSTEAASQSSTKKAYSTNNFSTNYKQSTGYKTHQQLQNFPPRIHQSFHNSVNQFHRTCPVCPEESHSIFSCEKFRRADKRSRLEMVTCAHLCKRCLRGHRSDCTQREGCRECGGNHHTFLHLDRQDERDSLLITAHQNQQEGNQASAVINSHHVSMQRTTPNLASTSTSNKVIQSHHVNTHSNEIRVENNQVDRYVTPWNSSVLLATAIILVRSAKDKKFYPFRALLDQASETSHISQSAAQRLGLENTPISASMSGLGGVSIVSANSVVNFEIGSKRIQSFEMKVQAVVVPKVTNLLPSAYIRRTDWNHIEGLHLADPEFYKPAEIDIILGAPVYGYILLPGLIKASPNNPVAQNTEFGWILSGATELAPKPIKSFHLRLELNAKSKRVQEEDWRKRKSIGTPSKFDSWQSLRWNIASRNGNSGIRDDHNRKDRFGSNRNFGFDRSRERYGFWDRVSGEITGRRRNVFQHDKNVHNH